MNYMTCGKCRNKYPATTDFFHKNPDGKYGLRSYCKYCRSNKKKIKSVGDGKALYIGEYNNRGERHGRGMIVFPNGSRFVGEFENGERHGEGYFIFSDGKREEATWTKGNINL